MRANPLSQRGAANLRLLFVAVLLAGAAGYVGFILAGRPFSPATPDSPGKVLYKIDGISFLMRAPEAQIVLGWIEGSTQEQSSKHFFERYESVLPELFGTSQVSIQHATVVEGAAEKGAFYVQAKPASGIKCERCWRFVPDVGDEPKYPTVCLRCAEALAAVGFAPYEKQDTPPEAAA